MPQQDREKIDDRRQRVYQLYLMNYTQQAISEALKVPRTTVTDDIRILRKRNARWFERNKDPEARMRSLYKEVEDKLRKVENEGWVLYYNTPSENTGLRNTILAGLRNTIHELRLILEIVAPKLNEQWLQDKLREVERQQEKIRLLSKVKPLASPATI